MYAENYWSQQIFKQFKQNSKSNAKLLHGKHCWSNYVVTRELVKSLFYSPKPITPSTTSSLPHDIQNTCKMTSSLSPHHLPVKCSSKCILSNLVTKSHLKEKGEQQSVVSSVYTWLKTQETWFNNIHNKTILLQSTCTLYKYNVKDSNCTSLSSHFLTMMSSPVMSLILYIMFVADSCASRITPTIATLKQIQQA